MSQKQEILKEGWLKKQGHRGIIKPWRNRYYVLAKGEINYYDDKGGELLGTIYLVEIQKIVMDPSLDVFCFRIGVPGRDYVMKAVNENEMKGWIEEIESAKVEEDAKESTKAAIEIIKQGWLSKFGGRFHQKKRRWFVLTKARIAYYESAHEKIPLNSAMLDQLEVTEKKTTGKRKVFNFELVTPQRTFELEADAEDEMRDWMTAIEETKNRTDDAIRTRAATVQKTTLVYVASQDDINQVRELLDASEDPNQVINDQTPLHSAATAGRCDAAKLLLEYGADVRRVDGQGREAIHLAAGNGHRDIVKLCIESGSDINCPSKNLRTPIHYAAEGGHDQVVQFLIDKSASLDVQDDEGNTALHLTVVSGKERVARILMSVAGGGVNVKNKKKQTPLHLAIEQQFGDLVTLLLKHRAKVEVQDCNKLRPIHLAARLGNEQIMRSLVKADVDVNTVTENGQSALHLALAIGEKAKDTIMFLAVSGVDLNIKTDDGMTPLHVALENVNNPFYYKFAVYLVESGADVEARNNRGLNALHIAITKNSDKMAAFLLKHGAKVDAGSGEMNMSPLHLAAFHGNPQIVSHLLVANASVHALDAKGWTPLHYAGFKGSVPVISVLIEHKANVNATDRKGKTPLHAAWQGKNNDEAAHFLCSHGAIIGEGKQKKKQEQAQAVFIPGAPMPGMNPYGSPNMNANPYGSLTMTPPEQRLSGNYAPISPKMQAVRASGNFTAVNYPPMTPPQGVFNPAMQMQQGYPQHDVNAMQQQHMMSGAVASNQAPQPQQNVASQQVSQTNVSSKSKPPQNNKAPSSKRNSKKYKHGKHAPSDDDSDYSSDYSSSSDSSVSSREEKPKAKPVKKEPEKIIHEQKVPEKRVKSQPHDNPSSGSSSYSSSSESEEEFKPQKRAEKKPLPTKLGAPIGPPKMASAPAGRGRGGRRKGGLNIPAKK